jgi:hypothetical protein
MNFKDFAVDNARREFAVKTAPTLPAVEETYCPSCANAPGDGDRCPICGRNTPEDPAYVAYLAGPTDPRD